MAGWKMVSMILSLAHLLFCVGPSTPVFQWLESKIKPSYSNRISVKSVVLNHLCSLSRHNPGDFDCLFYMVFKYSKHSGSIHNNQQSHVSTEKFAGEILKAVHVALEDQ